MLGEGEEGGCWVGEVAVVDGVCDGGAAAGTAGDGDADDICCKVIKSLQTMVCFA